MEQLTHSLNFYSILIESFTIIFSWKKIFTQITIATIVPLSLLSLSHAQLSEFFFSNILHNSFKVTWDSFMWEEMAFCLFHIVYLIFFLVLSLISTTAVVYAVSRIYTTKDVCFVEVLGVVPKVWRRVMVTFWWSLMLVVVYNVASLSLLVPFSGSSDTARIAISGPIFAIYIIGFVYISIIWHLASVVSVLEEDCGVEAMIKSKAMVKGKMVISVAVIFLFLNLSFMLIQVVYKRFVVDGDLFWCRILWGFGCFLILSWFTLLGLVTQTIVYFICKSYGYEMTQKSYLGNHHKVYLGDYAPLRSCCDVQQYLDQC